MNNSGEKWTLLGGLAAMILCGVLIAATWVGGPSQVVIEDSVSIAPPLNDSVPKDVSDTQVAIALPVQDDAAEKTAELQAQKLADEVAERASREKAEQEKLALAAAEKLASDQAAASAAVQKIADEKAKALAAVQLEKENANLIAKLAQEKQEQEALEVARLAGEKRKEEAEKIATAGQAAEQLVAEKLAIETLAIKKAAEEERATKLATEVMVAEKARVAEKLAQEKVAASKKLAEAKAKLAQEKLAAAQLNEAARISAVQKAERDTAALAKKNAKILVDKLAKEKTAQETATREAALAVRLEAAKLKTTNEAKQKALSEKMEREKRLALAAANRARLERIAEANVAKKEQEVARAAQIRTPESATNEIATTAVITDASEDAPESLEIQFASIAALGDKAASVLQDISRTDVEGIVTETNDDSDQNARQQSVVLAAMLAKENITRIASQAKIDAEIAANRPLNAELTPDELLETRQAINTIRKTQNAKPKTTKKKIVVKKKKIKAKPTTTTGRLSRELRAQTARSITRCWRPSSAFNGKSTNKLVLRMSLNKQGFMLSSPKLLSRGNTSPAVAQAAFSAARRALTQCQPYKLPAAQYGAWRSMTITFEPGSLGVR